MMFDDPGRRNMNGLGGLNKSPEGAVIGLVQLQLPVVVTKEDLARQTDRIVAMVGKARRNLSTMDLVVFPEYSLHGLSMDTNPAIMCRLDGPEVTAFKQACIDQDLGLLLHHGPGITLVAPGNALIVPTVPTRPPSSVLQNSSIALMHSAAPDSASRRNAIGTVPAWPAMPVSATASRVAPEIAVTTPTGSPSASSTGPC